MRRAGDSNVFRQDSVRRIDRWNPTLDRGPAGIAAGDRSDGFRPTRDPWYVGSPTWARTRDLRINSPSLYQLSYQGISKPYTLRLL